MAHNSGDQTADLPAKKFYNRPQLQVYGDLREITNSSTRSVSAGVTDNIIHTHRSH